MTHIKPRIHQRSKYERFYPLHIKQFIEYECLLALLVKKKTYAV